jgi:triphosphoribosyl-dephospho-CoA synthase
VLGETTVADAADVYAAIRQAAPSGLGHAESQDVAEPPSVTLREAMALAAGRDAIAREYQTDFALTFEMGAPTLREARRAGLVWTDATVETYLSLLASVPDSHISRKLGLAEAERVSRRAAEASAAGGVRTSAGRAALAELDAELRDPRNSRNPGTTADLTAAALCVVIMESGWN